jgi:nitroreductase
MQLRSGRGWAFVGGAGQDDRHGCDRTLGAPDAGALAEEQWPAPYWFVDTGMATLMVLLTAADEGLGACFFGIMREDVDAFRAEFGVPDACWPVGAVSMGYGDSSTPPSRARHARRGVSEVVHRGQW